MERLGAGLDLSHRVKSFALVFLILLSSLANSESVPVASERDVSDFASLPRVREVNLSPDGTYFSSFVSYQGEVFLVVENLENQEEPYYVRGPNWHLSWYEWLTDNDILLSISAPSSMQGTPVLVSRLVHVDVSKRTSKVMFSKERRPSFYQDQSRYLGSLPEEPGYFLLQASGKSSPDPGIYKVKIGARRLPKATYHSSKRNILSWWVDAAGNVRAGYGTSSDQVSGVVLLRDASGKWHNYSDFASGEMNVINFPTQDLNKAYVAVPEGDHDALRELHIPSRSLGAVVASHPDSDIASVQMNQAGDQIAAIHFENESVSSIFRDETLQLINNTVNRHLSETTNLVTASTSDRSKVIVAAISDSQPLRYYLYDRVAKTMNYLTATYPSLVDSAPGEIITVSYRARDGLMIPAFLTLPKGTELKSMRAMPFVVYPHGGPAARDFARFDWIAQMLVEQGYGVMQINFRGSTGYGRAFQAAGHRQWGQAMQDDVTDGTRWLVDQGIADGERICIFGGSYGGYAALMGAIKEPDLYQCAASLNGVTDLRSLIGHARRYVGGKFGTRFIGRLWKDRKMLNKNSPRRRAEEIKIPVLLVHGEKDRVVPVAQSRKMRNVLGEQLYKYVELPEGSHSLTRQENRLAFAYELIEFLDLQIGGKSNAGKLASQ